MNILQIDYTLLYNSLDIYTAGCKGINGKHCLGCHNKETWNFNQGEPYSDKYFEKIKKYDNDFFFLIKNIMIFGGEPLDNPTEEVLKLLIDLNTLNKKIWLFTRKELNEVPFKIQSFCDYIKTGSFKKELLVDDNIQFGIKLSTSNQKIFKIK